MGKSIILKVKGNMMGVFPTTRAVSDLLAPVTTYLHTENTPGKGYQSFKRELFSIEPDGTFLTMSGFESRVHRRLSAYGYNVTVQRLESTELYCNLDKLNDEDLSNLADREDQVAVLGLVVDSPHGFIVEAPTGWGKSYVLTQICKILPRANIAIIAPGRSIASSLYTRLKPHIRDVGRAGDGFKDIRRVTISTMTSLSMLSHTNKPWDIVLFDEVHRAGAPQVSQDFIASFPMAKCIGFSASPTGRSDNADALVEGMFGPIMYRVGYNEAVKRGAVVPINAFMVPVDIGPDFASGTNPSVLNRRGLWLNEYRNRLIADIANGLPDDAQRLILVSVACHGYALKKLLPDYQFAFTSVSSTKIKNSEEFRAMPGINPSTGEMERAYLEFLRKEFEANRIKKAIATSIWDTGVDFAHLKYLIRTDGGSSTIKSVQAPGRLSRNAVGKKSGVLIDFTDEFCATLMRRSASRVKTYREIGFNVTKLLHNDDRAINSIIASS